MVELIKLKGIERATDDRETQSVFGPSSSVQSPISNPKPPTGPQSPTPNPQALTTNPQLSTPNPEPPTPNPHYWRSLDELAESEEFEELLHREFPERASEWSDAVGRRKFLKLMGASLALSGLTACTRQPTEYIAPYVRQPEELVPGKPVYFATAMALEQDCSSKVTKADRQKLRATRSIPRAWVRLTCFRRLRCSRFMTLIVLKHLLI
jgi:MoCo/4Fe-4S cofactor protein with predicted Tat translocation signal